MVVEVGDIGVDRGDVAEDVGHSGCLSNESTREDGKSGCKLHFVEMRRICVVLEGQKILQ